MFYISLNQFWSLTTPSLPLYVRTNFPVELPDVHQHGLAKLTTSFQSAEWSCLRTHCMSVLKADITAHTPLPPLHMATGWEASPSNMRATLTVIQIGQAKTTVYGIVTGHSSRKAGSIYVLCISEYASQFSFSYQIATWRISSFSLQISFVHCGKAYNSLNAGNTWESSQY